MKKRIVSILFLLSSIALLSSSILFAAGSQEKAAANEKERIKARGVLNVGVKVDVPGFGYKDISTGANEGFEIDLARKIAGAILGDESKVAFTPVMAKTRGPLLDTGELDVVIATFTVTDERRLSYEFSTIYYTDAVSLLVKKAGGYKSLKDLAGKTIGVAQSATTKSILEAEGKSLGVSFKFLEYASYPELKVALDSGRIDAFSVDRAILMGYVEDTTEILADKYAPQQYGVAMKKGNTALLDVVNTTIADLDKSGELLRMKAVWGLDK